MYETYIISKEWENQAITSVKELFYYYSNYGTPFEWKRIGFTQFKQFAKDFSAALVIEDFLYMDSTFIISILMNCFYICSTFDVSKDPGNNNKRAPEYSMFGRFLTYNEWRDVLELATRFFFLNQSLFKSTSSVQGMKGDVSTSGINFKVNKSMSWVV